MERDEDRTIAVIIAATVDSPPYNLWHLALLHNSQGMGAGDDPPHLAISDEAPGDIGRWRQQH